MIALVLLLLALLIAGSCHVDANGPTFPRDAHEIARQEMVARQIRARGIRAPAVLQAMQRVPRHRFVPSHYSAHAYADSPLPIGYGQTISQPYIVALMTEALGLTAEDKVLEIGTGSGYQTAILAETAGRVFTIELVPCLAETALTTLTELGYTNVRARVGDGSRGWPEQAPFDAIIVAAASQEVPKALREQLAVGGRLLLPIGDTEQRLLLYRRTVDGYARTDLGAVRFVPLVDGDY